MSPSRDEAGFSLIETIVATALLAGSIAMLGQLLAMSIVNNAHSRAVTYGGILAAQKMEQLRSLLYAFDPNGLPITDTSTNVAVSPAAAGGGRGLSPSPDSALRNDTSGYVDYLDGRGEWLGTGTTPPVGTVYVRRWSIEPLPIDRPDALLLQVVVSGFRSRGDQVRLVSLKVRKPP